MFLQGWGEPFLNPDFFAMASMAKQEGCQVGVTTNGMLLDRDTSTRLVDIGFDVVAFSLAGVDERNDAFREGTELNVVLDAIQTLNRDKEKRGLTKPAIHIAYILLRSGIEDVKSLPGMLEGMGISQVMITTLDFVATEGMEGEAIAPATPGEYHELRSLLASVAAEGRDRRIDMHYQLYCAGRPRLTCTENIERAVFLSADGTISPCVFTRIPVSGASYRLNGDERHYEPMAFGTITEQELPEIWRQKAYAAFRKSFYRERFAPLCKHCPKRFVA